MTSSLNDIVNYEIIATDNVTIFYERIFPLMNITVVAANTTISSVVNNITLPIDTISVESTDNFPSSGNLTIVDSNGSETINYTGISGNSFTGCTGGTGTLSTGDVVYLQLSTSWLIFPNDAPFTATIISKYLTSPFSALLASAAGSAGSLTASPTTTVTLGSDGYVAGNYTINVSSTTDFPSSGYLYIDEAQIQYAGTTPTSFTGCAGGTETMFTGDSVYSVLTATISYNSNTAVLPQNDIHVVSTAGWPSSGSMLVDSNAGTQLISYTGITSNSFTGCTGGTGTLSTGGSIYPQNTQCSSALELPQSVIPVYSTAGFPASGSIIIVIENVSPYQYQVINYTSITGGGSPSFNGCTGGTQNILINSPIISNIGQETTIASSSNGQIMGQFTLDVASTAGFPTSGIIHVTDSNGTEAISYTGISGNTLTGCSGGTGVFTAGSAGLTLPQSTITVAETAYLARSGSILIRTTGGDELVSYTGTDPTESQFIGCSGGTTLLNLNDIVFPYPSPIYATINSASPVMSLPTSVIYISTPGYLFPSSSGTIYIMSSAGLQKVLYNGQFNEGPYAYFYGCTGGTGTLADGYAVYPYVSPTYCTVAADSNGYTLSGSPTSTIYVASTAAFPAASGSPEFDANLIINDTQGSSVLNPSAGDDSISYTGTTGTTFAGVTGGVGTLFTGNLVANYGTQATLQTPSYPGSLPQTTLTVDTTAGFAPAGGLFLNASSEIVTYTGLTGTTFTGCSGGTGTLTSANVIPVNTDIASGSNGAVLPQPIIYTSSTVGFPTSGYIIVTSSTGLQIVAYTGTSGGNSFTGCTGGSGFLSTSTHSITQSAVTTVAANSNGQDLTKDTIYVNSTAGFPPSGSFYIFDSANGGAGEFVYYTGLTSTAFNGCYGGSGTLTAGDIISNYNFTHIVDADPVAFPFTTILTGIEGVAEQPYVLIGNSNSSGSDNDSTTTQNVVSHIGTAAIGFNPTGTVPDSNNGSLIWALTDYTYTGDEPIETSESNRIQFFVSDGHNLLLTQETQDSWSLINNSSATTGFNVITLSGNLENINFNSSGASAPFSVAVPTGSQFSVNIENNTGYTITFGYTSDDSTFTGDTVTLNTGDAIFVFGDGANVFTPTAILTPPVPVLVTFNYGPTYDQSGTSYLIQNAYLTVTLPSAPLDGTYYVFKDQNGNFSSNNPFTIDSSGSDFLFTPNGATTSLLYTTPYLAFTLQYFATDLTWRVISKSDNELNPLWIASTTTVADIRQQDYLVDTSGGAISFSTYDNIATPIDGQIFTLKDATQSGSGGNWSTNPLTIVTATANIEYPAGTINAPAPVSLLVQPVSNGLYLKFRYDTLSNVWLLIETNN